MVFDGEIDVLLGSDYYWSLISGKIVKSSLNDNLVAMETKLGWVVSGALCGEGNRSYLSGLVNSDHVIRIDCVSSSRLDEEVSKFWDLDTVGIRPHEGSTYDDFYDTITRNAENRYEIQLPFKQNHPIIHDNYKNSEARLMKLYEKLKDNRKLMKEYDDIFQEQKSFGIIEEAPDTTKPGESYYMPHRAVIREDKLTTKVRVVFDASSKSAGPSLNDCLYKGPQLTPLLYDVLLRFRAHEIALTSDITKAFSQISVDTQDRDYLRFLWFDNIFSEQPTVVRNRFARMVFGVTSSPFGLNGTIRKHAKSYQFDEKFYQSVIQSFFVDDFVGGEQTINTTLELFKKLRLRFLEGHFWLRKWRTNNETLRSRIKEITQEKTYETNNEEKILGLAWNDKKDIFIYDFSNIIEMTKSMQPTKRNLLKILSSFYDPLGIIQPILISLKILLQQIHKSKIGWDDELVDSLKEGWLKCLSEIEEFERIEVDRRFEEVMRVTRLFGVNFMVLVTLVIKHFGACVYVRSVCLSGRVNVKLLTSKSRVAPLKDCTIPRLELMGNLLLATLVTSVKKALENTVELHKTVFWTDSQVTLAWIKSYKKEFKTFVENRLQKIRELTNASDWFYVKSAENPADIITKTRTILLKDDVIWLERSKLPSQSQQRISNRRKTFKRKLSRLNHVRN